MSKAGKDLQLHAVGLNENTKSERRKTPNFVHIWSTVLVESGFEGLWFVSVTFSQF